MNIDEMFSPRDDVEMKLLTERLHSYIKRIRELRSGAQSVDSHSFFKVSIFKILCAEALGIWNYNFFVRSQTLRSLVNFLWQFGKASVMMVQPSACRITSFYKTQNDLLLYWLSILLVGWFYGGGNEKLEKHVWKGNQQTEAAFRRIFSSEKHAAAPKQQTRGYSFWFTN